MEVKTELRYYFTHFTSNNLKYTAMNHVCYYHEVNRGVLLHFGSSKLPNMSNVVISPNRLTAYF